MSLSGGDDTGINQPCKPGVYVVDDDEAVRRSLARLLRVSGFRVEVFASAPEFLAREATDEDSCVLTDLRMPGMSGLELQERARAAGHSLPFIFITGHGDVPDAVTAMKGGAVDFLEKPVDPQALLTAVRAAIESGRAGRRERASVQEARNLLALLTPRERQVCELVGQGLLNKQIAATLGTSEKTVKAQRGSATRKLNTGSTAALIDILRRAGQ